MTQTSRTGLWLGAAGLVALVLAALVWSRIGTSAAQTTAPPTTAPPPSAVVAAPGARVAEPSTGTRAAPATRVSAAPVSIPEPAPAHQTAVPATGRTITVNGTGEANGRPDQTRITLGTEVQAATAGDAQSQNAAKINAVTDAVKRAGIPTENIQTTSVNLFPIYSQEPRPVPGRTPAAPVVEGYRASATIRIEVPGVDQTGAIVDAAVRAGADQVQGIEFSLQDDSALRAEALRLAVADARRRADALAAAIGTQVSSVEAIVESGATVPPPRPLAAPAAAEARTADATTVEPGQLTVRAGVSVTFGY